MRMSGRRWFPRIARMRAGFGRAPKSTTRVFRFFIQNFGKFGNIFCEIGILIIRVNDFKFCVDLGLTISNLPILQNCNFSKISKFVSKKSFIANFVGFRFVNGRAGPGRCGDRNVWEHSRSAESRQKRKVSQILNIFIHQISDLHNSNFHQ